MSERTFTVTLQDANKRPSKAVAAIFTESELRQSDKLSRMLTQFLTVEENIDQSRTI